MEEPGSQSFQEASEGPVAADDQAPSEKEGKKGSKPVAKAKAKAKSSAAKKRPAAE